MFKKVLDGLDMPIACDEDGITGEIVMAKKFSKRISKSINDVIGEKHERRQTNSGNREVDRTHEQYGDKEE